MLPMMSTPGSGWASRVIARVSPRAVSTVSHCLPPPNPACRKLRVAASGGRILPVSRRGRRAGDGRPPPSGAPPKPGRRGGFLERGPPIVPPIRHPAGRRSGPARRVDPLQVLLHTIVRFGRRDEREARYVAGARRARQAARRMPALAACPAPAFAGGATPGTARAAAGAMATTVKARVRRGRSSPDRTPSILRRELRARKRMDPTISAT